MKGIEKSFLESWSGWDEFDTFGLQFYKPVYKQNVGIPDDVIDKAGDDSCFIVDCERSTIHISNGCGDEIFKSNVKLIIE